MTCFYAKSGNCVRYGVKATKGFCQQCGRLGLEGMADYLAARRRVMYGTPGPQKRIKNQQQPEATEDAVKKRLALCKGCEHATYEKLDGDAGAGAAVRVAGNVFHVVLAQLGLRSLRCCVCGCFIEAKVRLAGNGGCPKRKW